MKPAHVPLGFLHPVFRSVGDAFRNRWLADLGLTAAELFDPDAELDVTTFDSILEDSAVATGNPAIGLVHSAVDIVIESSAPYPPARWVEDSTEDFVVDGLSYFRRLLLEGNLICAPTVLARRAAVTPCLSFPKTSARVRFHWILIFGLSMARFAMIFEARSWSRRWIMWTMLANFVR